MISIKGHKAVGDIEAKDIKRSVEKRNRRFTVTNGSEYFVVDTAAEQKTLDFLNVVTRNRLSNKDSSNQLPYSKICQELCTGNPLLIECIYSTIAMINARIDSCIESYLED